jgi:hypothetical protein
MNGNKKQKSTADTSINDIIIALCLGAFRDAISGLLRAFLLLCLDAKRATFGLRERERAR